MQNSLLLEKFDDFDANQIFEKLIIPRRVGDFSKILSCVKSANFSQNGVLQKPQQPEQSFLTSPHLCQPPILPMNRQKWPESQKSGHLRPKLAGLWSEMAGLCILGLKGGCMDFFGKKEAVVRFLERKGVPVSLKEILAFLGEEFKERTVRRWLEEMVLAGTVEKSGQGKATHYQLPRKKQEFARTKEKSFFEGKNFESITYTLKPLYERTPVSYNNEWFDHYEPNSTHYLPHALREELYKKGIRETNHDPAGTYAQHIFNRLLIDLSFNSSRLEGNTYSLLDTERLILSGTGVEGKLDEEKIMILNHKDTIRFLVENAPRLKVELQTICTIHYLLSDGLVEPKYAGKVRDLTVRVSGSTYVPLEGTLAIQNQLAKITYKASTIEDPYEQAFFLLVHLSYLQGFVDVNKKNCSPLCKHSFYRQKSCPALLQRHKQRRLHVSNNRELYELQDVNPMADLFAFSYE